MSLCSCSSKLPITNYQLWQLPILSTPPFLSQKTYKKPTLHQLGSPKAVAGALFVHSVHPPLCPQSHARNLRAWPGGLFNPVNRWRGSAVLLLAMSYYAQQAFVSAAASFSCSVSAFRM